jgi:hypothetical protein
MTHERFIASQKRRIEVGCLAGHYTAEAIDGFLEDQVANMDEDDEAARAAILAELRAHLRSSWQAATALEATWTERTKLDRLDDALRDLAKGPHPVVKFVRPASQGDDPNDETWWHDEDDPLEDTDRGRHLVVMVDYEDGALHARGSLAWPTAVRRADFQPVVDEVVRVLGAHGIAASFDEKAAALLTERFPYQKRRTTSAPGEPAVAPPAPAKPGPCPRCGGKGWIKPADPSQFPEVCGCTR